MDLELGMADLGLAYRLLEQRFGKNCKQKLTFEPYGGLRYVYLLEKVDLTSDFVLIDSRGKRLGKSENWVEPFIGGRIIWDLNDKMAINVRADAGGFGIGSASKLIWNFVADIEYKLTKKVSLSAGYKILDIDYSRGSGSDKLGVDGKLKGPVIGMTILF